MPVLFEDDDIRVSQPWLGIRCNILDKRTNQKRTLDMTLQTQFGFVYKNIRHGKYSLKPAETKIAAERLLFRWLAYSTFHPNSDEAITFRGSTPEALIDKLYIQVTFLDPLEF